jgi:hypothetical protein
MMKDMASTVSKLMIKPTEATAASKLMINCYGSNFPLNMGRVIGL